MFFMETKGGNKMKLRNLLFLILGCICMGLGCIGIALPILPTVPFFWRRCSFSPILHSGCMTGLWGQRCIKSIWKPL